MAEKKTYMTWLNDAYGMEKNIENMLEQQVKQAKDHPNIQSRIQEHLDATRQHADLVKGCIERNGGNVSNLKGFTANVMGTITGATTGPAKDTLMKDAISDFAVENFEIASYKSLIDAAQMLGDTQTVQVCERILRDEEAMAHWLENSIPTVTQMYIEPDGHNTTYSG